MIEHFAAALQGQVQLSLTPSESVKQMRLWMHWSGRRVRVKWCVWEIHTDLAIGISDAARTSSSECPVSKLLH